MILFLSAFSHFIWWCAILIVFLQTETYIKMEGSELTYEAAIERLEKLAKEMENGDLPIDQLASKLSEAQQMLQFCKDKLMKADEEVQKLLEEQE